MWESVDIHITNSGEPVEGVLVRVYGNEGLDVHTEQLTDSEGHVGTLLPPGAYSMRFYKFGWSFKQPQNFDVISGGVNIFDVTATALDQPLANDPRLCRCSGYFRDLNGLAKRYLDMHFVAAFSPILLEGSGVVSERVSIRTDINGWAYIDLIRGAEYLAYVESMGIEGRKIRVPDAPSSNLPDVLLPVVDKAILGVDSPLVIAVGETKVLTPTVLDSSGVPLAGIANGDVAWKVDNSAVVALATTPTTLELTGMSPGSAELVAERLDQSIIRIPQTDIQGLPLSITVS